MTVEPFLFSTDPRLLFEFSRIDSADQLPGAVVVDWERKGKQSRQNSATSRIGFDTSLRFDSELDLARARQALSLPIICRINTFGEATALEIERAIELGADEILLPMVRTENEVTCALRLADGRVGVGVMIETKEAVAISGAIAKLPISRAFVGLVDLALDRGSSSIFDALIDGTTDTVRNAIGQVPFGVGGLTLPTQGAPIPARLLMSEIVRLRCSFSFLRRSFLADVRDVPPGLAIREIRCALDAFSRRTDAEIARDHREFVRASKDAAGAR